MPSRLIVFGMLLLQSMLVTAKERTTPIANDPLLFGKSVSQLQQYHLYRHANGLTIDYPRAWKLAKGHALLGLLDGAIDLEHPDTLGQIRQHLSTPLQRVSSGKPGSGANYFSHGSWVLSVLAPSSNNGGGLAGACQDCSVVYQLHEGLKFEPLWRLANQGTQVVSLSFGTVPPSTYGCANDPTFCDGLAELDRRDVLVVGVGANRAQGDPARYSSWPASIDTVMQIGGVDRQLQFWDDCDDEYRRDCGAFASPDLDLVAPAQQISVGYVAQRDRVPQGQLGICGRQAKASAWYDYCSGTSFAAPQVAALAGVVRSVYPQMRAGDVRRLLQQTAQSPYAEHHEQWGFGLIDPLAAVSAVLGQSGGIQQTNRVVPLMGIRDPVGGDTAFSTVPQFLSSALMGNLRKRTEDSSLRIHYRLLSEGLSLSGYQLPAINLMPRAVMYLLSTHNDPLEAGRELIPLYRLSKTVGTTSLRHAYVTEPHLPALFAKGYVIDVIEGYLFPPCAAGDPQCQPPKHSQCVLARSNAAIQPDWIVALSSQLQSDSYGEYDVPLVGDPCLGYAYAPVDTDGDGLINGYEAFLGTNPDAADSDGDGRSDGQEMMEPVDGLFSDPAEHAADHLIDASLNGAWFYPDTSGQGLLLDIIESDREVFAAWFTHDLAAGNNNAQIGSSDHRWFTAQGNYTENEAKLTIYRTTGGRFGAEDMVSNKAVGTLNLRFDDCLNGVATYHFAESTISGAFPLTRLTQNQRCGEQDPAQTPTDLFSGAWYNPATRGQGLLLDVDGINQQAFVAWFTFDSLGTASGEGAFAAKDQRWFTAQGDFDIDGGVLTLNNTDQGLFDTTTQTSTLAIGTLAFQMVSCSSAIVSYQFGGMEGTFPVTRLSPTVGCP